MVACRTHQDARRERDAENQRNYVQSRMAFALRKTAQRSWAPIPTLGKNAKAATQKRDSKIVDRGTCQRSVGESDTKPTAQTPSTAALFPYETENDLRASRTVRYWRWLMGTASSQSMTNPSEEAWTTCSMFAR